MTDWKPFHDWMELTNLNVQEGLTNSFTIGYRFTDDRTDKWTARFNRFKFENSTRSAAIFGAMYLMKVAVPILVDSLALKYSKTVLVPALSSSETIASKNGVISVMTRLCAKEANMNFVRDAITKKEHTPLHRFSKSETRSLRRRNLNSGYYRNRSKWCVVELTKRAEVWVDSKSKETIISHVKQIVRI